MEVLKIILTLISLFVLGSVVGYLVELFWRRFVSQHHWVNPGFMVGPYLPIYGFGTVALYGINYLISLIPFTPELEWLKIVSTILIIGVALTLIEFIAGLIFIKCLKVKLWDYSNMKGNIMGIICPLYFLFWLAAGAVYYFFINEPLVKFVTFLVNHEIYYLFIGVVIGMILVDFCYSLHVATKLKTFAKENKVVVSLLQFQDYAKEKNAVAKDKLNQNSKTPFFFRYGNLKGLMESLKIKNVIKMKS